MICMILAHIGPKSNGAKNGMKNKDYGSGKATLRFKSNGTAAIEQAVSGI